MDELYNSNKDFRDYVDRYCKAYRCTKEEAFEHVLVQMVGKQYREKEEAQNAIKTD